MVPVRIMISARSLGPGPGPAVLRVRLRNHDHDDHDAATVTSCIYPALPLALAAILRLLLRLDGTPQRANLVLLRGSKHTHCRL
jgi:hypothetical protein